MKRISMFLSRSQLEGLKRISDQQGLSMSEIVRRALDHFLEAFHSKSSSAIGGNSAKKGRGQ